MLVLAGSCAVALVLVLVGIVRVIAMQRRLRRHFQSLRDSQLLTVDPAHFADGWRSIQRSIDQAGALLERVAAALRRIREV